MEKQILGLDLGTNSIGWALIKQNTNQNTGSIVNIGSRIIPMSQDILGNFDKGVSISQTAERTQYRGVRRLRERHLLRRERLHRVLNILGFLPAHYSNQIDFNKKLGQFKPGTEPKLAYDENYSFIFLKSYEEMLLEFKTHQPDLFSFRNGKVARLPFDWTIYYLRKKALTQKIEKGELAWLLLNFNQKRGYYQLRGEEEEVPKDKKIEFFALKVLEVNADTNNQKKNETWYSMILENGWVYRRSSKIPLHEWKDKVKEFIVTTDLNDDGTEKKDKDGNVKRSFRAPNDTDWTLVKTKTEQIIEKSGKHIGEYIFDTLLKNPSQKINGRLIRVIERKFYKAELEQILLAQIHFHQELNDKRLYELCMEELYEFNEAHRNNIAHKNFTHLFLNDIIFYQRPLKSKKSLISDCKFESKSFIHEGNRQIQPLKCISKSHPLYQEFRLWQWIQNLHIFNIENDQAPITKQFISTEEDVIRLFDFLNDRKEITEEILIKFLLSPLKLKPKELKQEVAKYRWNYVRDKKYPCNVTRNLIISKLGQEKCEQFLTQENEIKIWELLYSVNTKKEADQALSYNPKREEKNKKSNRKSIYTLLLENNFTNDEIDAIKNAHISETDYGSFSLKAIRKLLPLMRYGKYWNEQSINPSTMVRINNIINGEYSEDLHERVRQKSINLESIEDFRGLPIWLTSYIVYNRHSEEANLERWNSPNDLQLFLQQFKQHSLRNPIVEQVITETLRVVKDIWTTYGNSRVNFFDEIHIELGREMKNPAELRKKTTEQITINENTNLRIKLLLAEMATGKDIENVRPYSPAQLEILKIYEDGILNSDIEIDDDILRISKSAQPSKSDLQKYKLWLEQKYRSPYTGQIIPLSKLFTPAYEIEHIIPQSRYFDDSFSNKVICESEINKEKDNKLAFEYIQDNGGKKVELSGGRYVTVLTVEEYTQLIKHNYSKNYSKAKKLMLLDIPEKMIERQLNDTRYISKEVKNLLSKIVRNEKNDDGVTSVNVLSCNGQITSQLKQDWGLNDVWNEIITPRFIRLNKLSGDDDKYGHINPNTNRFLPTVPLNQQKGFNKKRIDHRHHALDALVIACATRNHINYLNNQNALERHKSKEEKQKSREDLKRLLCVKKYNSDSEKNYRWIFKKPWDNFTIEAKNKLDTTIISFKQNLRIINRTKNVYQHWVTQNGILKKVNAIQKGVWAIRKPMHKDTVSGLVNLKRKKEVSLAIALDEPNLIVDQTLKGEVLKMFVELKDKKKVLSEFKSKKYLFNGLNIAKVEVYFWDSENVASRVALDDSFNTKKIESITDLGIQTILKKHLALYNENVNGEITEHPEIAFSAEGVDELNKNILILNNGKSHKPIIKVRTYEPKGNKFMVGTQGNKKYKYVEAAKGTNLYFAIYIDKNGKRTYETIPFNEVVESQKQSALLNEKPKSVPSVNKNGDQLLFYLSPNDLVYIPTEEEAENPSLINFNNLNKEQVNQIYKVVSFTGPQCFLTPQNVAVSIVNKFEYSALNKMEKSTEGLMIKEVCWKMNSDRLGNVIGICNK